MNVGDRYGRLTVVSKVNDRVVCSCACGSPLKSILAQSVRSGNTKSCGCFAREKQAEVGRSSATHRMTKTREYKTWDSMRRRCSDTSYNSYAYYGGRGIYVAAEWETFEQFFADMGHRPAGMSIDRLDNDGPYCKSNCRWATPLQQTRNRRNAVLIELDGEIRPLQVWCDEFHASYSTVHSRIFKHGWPVLHALTKPKNARLNPTKQRTAA